MATPRGEPAERPTGRPQARTVAARRAAAARDGLRHMFSSRSAGSTVCRTRGSSGSRTRRHDRPAGGVTRGFRPGSPFKEHLDHFPPPFETLFGLPPKDRFAISGPPVATRNRHGTSGSTAVAGLACIAISPSGARHLLASPWTFIFVCAGEKHHSRMQGRARVESEAATRGCVSS